MSNSGMSLYEQSIKYNCEGIKCLENAQREKDMAELTKSYYDAIKRIKELVEEVEELENEVESLKGDKVELRSIRGH